MKKAKSKNKRKVITTAITKPKKRTRRRKRQNFGLRPGELERMATLSLLSQLTYEFLSRMLPKGMDRFVPKHGLPAPVDQKCVDAEFSDDDDVLNAEYIGE